MDEKQRENIAIENNERTHRFETHVGGQLAFISYRRIAGKIAFLHTEVPPSLEGHGLAGKLARAALDYARSEALEVIPLCPFVAAYIRRHPNYQELVAAAHLKRILSEENQSS